MKITTDLDSAVNHLSKGINSIIEAKLKVIIKKEADAIVDKIAKEMAKGLLASISSWNDYAQDKIQIVISIDGVAESKRLMDDKL